MGTSNASAPSARALFTGSLLWGTFFLLPPIPSNLARGYTLREKFGYTPLPLGPRNPRFWVGPGPARACAVRGARACAGSISVMAWFRQLAMKSKDSSGPREHCLRYSEFYCTVWMTEAELLAMFESP
jgi:hypothetical protein